MKKTYKDPEILIENFDTENVITSSDKTAEDSLKSQYSKVQTFEADWETMQGPTELIF